MLQCLLNSETQRNLMHLDISGFEEAVYRNESDRSPKCFYREIRKIAKKFTESPMFGNFEDWNVENGRAWKFCESEDEVLRILEF
ncbi:hypothetical protein B9Z55_008433 [Caenorhabditis nigoni]|nr:hypothetical protein B9Z55_008433 [Caenorhabditis nigoni]